MKIAPIVAIFCVGALLPSVKGDSPAEPFPWVTTSKRGSYLFKMVPPKWRNQGKTFVLDREAFGVAYKITEKGEFQEIWRTQGWYTFKGYLSEDGRYFVRFGPWASDLEKHTDLAIAFYKQGKLIKKYEVRELIQDPDQLVESTSHYTWHPVTQTEPNGFYGKTFHLVLIDKTAYSFDCETGEIIIQKRDEGAKSPR